MRGRIAWFVAGSAAGVYATAKARRAAYRLSTPGLVDQAAALGLGWRAFSAELRDGMQVREQQIAHTLSAKNESDDTFGLDQALPDNTLPNKGHN